MQMGTLLTACRISEKLVGFSTNFWNNGYRVGNHRGTSVTDKKKPFFDISLNYRSDLRCKVSIAQCRPSFHFARCLLLYT